MYDFTKLEIKDLDGNLVPGVDKTLANLIYRFSPSLDLVETARQINAGKPVALSESDKKIILQIVKDPKQGVFAFVQLAIENFLKEKPEEEPKTKK